MNTTTKKVELVTLTPDEGMWLMKDTGQGRTYSRRVVLGAGDSADAWREITDEEKQAMEAEDEAEAEKMRDEALGQAGINEN